MEYYPKKHQKRQCQFGKVHFSMFDEVVEIPNLSNWSQDEIRSTWYTRNEWVEMRRELHRIINLKLQGHRIPTKDCCVGLDTDQETMIRRKDAKHQGLVAVLMTQQIQRENNVYDPGYIADIYFDYTSDNALEANCRAFTLARDVSEIHQF